MKFTLEMGANGEYTQSHNVQTLYSHWRWVPIVNIHKVTMYSHNFCGVMISLCKYILIDSVLHEIHIRDGYQRWVYTKLQCTAIISVVLCFLWVLHAWNLTVYCMKFTLEMGTNGEYTQIHNVQTIMVVLCFLWVSIYTTWECTAWNSHWRWVPLVNIHWNTMCRHLLSMMLWFYPVNIH